MKRLILGLAAVLVMGIASVSAFGFQPEKASAAPAPPQCNDEMNGGGTQVHCTVSIINYIAAGGGLAETPPSTLTMTRCVGASGPVSTLTCATTVTTLTAPVTSVSQCNYSGDGGGGTVRCRVNITNHFAAQPGVILPASVYQCIGSVITGPGAPAICTPANTAGITAASQATVRQCNDSGNGGTNVAFICRVSTGSHGYGLPDQHQPVQQLRQWRRSGGGVRSLGDEPGHSARNSNRGSGHADKHAGS